MKRNWENILLSGKAQFPLCLDEGGRHWRLAVFCRCVDGRPSMGKSLEASDQWGSMDAMTRPTSSVTEMWRISHSK